MTVPQIIADIVSRSNGKDRIIINHIITYPGGGVSSGFLDIFTGMFHQIDSYINAIDPPNHHTLAISVLYFGGLNVPPMETSGYFKT